MSLTPTEIKEHIEGQQKLTKELRDTIKDGVPLSAEDKAKVEKIEKAFEKHDETNAKWVADQEKKDKLIEDQKQRMDELNETVKMLEKKFGQLGGKGSGFGPQAPIVKAFESYVVRGKDGLSTSEKQLFNEIEKKYYRTDVLTDVGALLMPAQMSDEIIKDITEISPMRQVCRVKPTSSKSYIQPVRTTLLTAGDTGEGESITETMSKYGEVEIFVKKMTARIPLTTEVLMDSAFNVENEILTDAREEFERKEGYWFVLGAGPKQAKGLMNDANIGVTNSGNATNITSDSLIAVTGELKTGYQPLFAFNRRTLATIRQFKTGQGQYLWVPSGSTGLAPAAPNEINGYRYILMEDMPDTGAGLEPVIYGDFRRGYLIIDRAGMSILRDPYTQSENDKIVFTITKRVGGDVVQPEAFQKLKCAV
jgi:HK97 family phage major capsid protein